MVSQVPAAYEGALAAEPAGHRERLIAAMAASIEEKGYRDTTVADVVRLARTSRRNFYEHFADRDACFLALFDATNETMIRGLATLERFAEMLVGFVESGRRAQPELTLRPLTMDSAIIIVGGLRELLVIALQRGRDMRELRASAGQTIKAILGGALL
jgi:AcrR family transcriptional regulator